MTDEYTQSTEDRCGCCGTPVLAKIPIEDNYPTVEICLRCQSYRIWVRKNGELHRTPWITPEVCCKNQALFTRRVGERLDVVCNSCGKMIDTQSNE